MDKITEQLLSIESDAQQAINAMAKENAHLTHLAEENLTRRLAELEKNADETAKRLTQEADAATAAQIESVRDEYRAKTAEFENAFRASQDDLRGRIVRDVLHGKP